MTEEKKSYSVLKAEAEKFFESELPELVKSANSHIQKPFEQWLKEVYKELISRKGEEGSYEVSIQLVREKLPSLKEALKSGAETTYVRFILDQLKQKISSTPENIKEDQPAERYESQADDSIRVQVLKKVKSLGRAFQKKPRQQNIPFRDLLTEEFLKDTRWLEIWLSESFKDISEILDLFLEKENPEAKPDAKGQDKTAEKFEVAVINDFEKHLELAIKRVESEEIFENRRFEEEISDLKERFTEKGERAGTIESKKPVFTFSRFGELTDKIEARNREVEETWNIFLESQIADLKVQNEIAQYGLIISDVQEKILQETHRYFRDYGYVPMENGVSSAKQIAKELEQSKSKNLSKKLIGTIRERLEKDVKEAILSPMRQHQEQQQVIARIQNITGDMQLELIRFSETMKLAEERQVELPNHKVKFDELQWRSLASRFITEKAIKKLRPAGLKFDQFISDMAAEVEETIQIVDVNLMAALESKAVDDEQESPFEIAHGGIQRAIIMFEKSIKTVREKQNEYEKVVKSDLPQTLNQLAETMLKRDYDMFELKDKALQVKQTATDWKSAFVKKWAKFAEQVELLWRFSSKKIEKWWGKTALFLGFKDESALSTSEKRSLAEYLAKAVIEVDLPFIYKRLFDDQFEIDERFYIPPKGLVNSIGNSLKDWENNLDANALIVGEKGSGKSTAIQLLIKNTFNKTGYKVNRLRFDQTFYTNEKLTEQVCKALNLNEASSIEEITDKINNRKKREIFIVENLHNAYVRNLHGFEALESFWSLMSSTKENLFWLVTTSRYSWKFFEKMSGADQYFSHITEADSLNKEEIERAIMTRHRATGYALKFEASQALKKSRALRKIIDDEEKTQEYLRENYFTRLSNISEGNLSIAIIFWLQSIESFDENVFNIKPLEIADVDKLEIPSRNVLFTLAAFVIHDRLTTDEVALALHQSSQTSNLMLNRLKSKGILVKTDDGYLMNHLVYRQVIRLLKRRNIIH